MTRIASLTLICEAELRRRSDSSAESWRTLRAAADRGDAWLSRFRGLRANASAKTHAELDNSTELDRGQPEDLARRMADLKRTFGFTIVGGCCGTDAEHLGRIADACR